MEICAPNRRKMMIILQLSRDLVSWTAVDFPLLAELRWLQYNLKI